MEIRKCPRELMKENKKMSKVKLTKSKLREIIREEYLTEAKKTIRVFWNSKFRYYDNFEQVIKDFSKEEIADANFSLLLGATVIYSFLGSEEKALKNKLKKEMK